MLVTNHEDTLSYAVSQAFGCFQLNEMHMSRDMTNNVVCVTSKASDQTAHMRSLIRAFVSRLNIL